jgi:thiol-disulfide isomerase/thioredoxin
MNSRIRFLAVALAAFAVSIASPVIAVDVAAPLRLVKDVYPGLTSGPLSSARLVTLRKGVLFRAGTAKLVQKDLDADIIKAPEAIRPQLKRNLFFVLEGKATRPLLLVEARDWSGKQGRDPKETDEALLGSYFAGLTEKLVVADDEMKVFYDKNKDMIGQATYEQVKDQIKGFLLDQKRQEFVEAHVSGIGDRNVIEVDQTWVAKQYSAAMLNPVDKARKSGKPTMIDFGADGCRPCEMMTPILETLKKEYSGKVNVLFVHVRKEQVLAARFGISSIPVQVFYDKDGKEYFRHVGFFAKDQIDAKLAEMGIK